MNYLKRSILCLACHWARSLLLLAMFAVISILILAGLSIKSAVGSSIINTRTAIGGKITLKPVDSLGSGSTVSVDVANKLKNLKQVDKYNYVLSGLGHGRSYTPIGAGRESDWSTPDTYLLGTVYSELYKDFMEQGSKLIEGRHLTECDIGMPYALIERSLADRNKLHVGDKLAIGSVDDKNNSIELEIIGIYEAANPAAALSPLLYPSNKVYMPYSVAEKIAGKSGVEFAEYFIKDPLEIDDFKSAALAMNLAGFDNYTLDAQDALFQRITKPLQNLSSLADIFVLAVALAGAIILGLIVIYLLKGRHYEIGVLVSLGETKVKIISQMVFEMLILVCLALIIALSASGIISENIAGIVQQSRIIQSDSAAAKDNPSQQLNMEHINDMIDTTISLNSVLILVSIMIAIVVLSAAIPCAFIMSYNPKKILLQIN